MVNDHLFLRFENTHLESLIVVIDPPVFDVELKRGEFLLVKIVDFKKSGQDISGLITIRYVPENFINVDIASIFLQVVTIMNGEEEIIWGFDTEERPEGLKDPS